MAAGARICSLIGATCIVAAGVLWGLVPLRPAAAQMRAPSPGAESPAAPQMREACPGLVASGPADKSAAFRRVALQDDQVRITYSGHATFLIESPQLVRIATDYNDYVRPPLIPDIATMNHANISHYTDSPDPAIKYVLRGWSTSEAPAHYDLQYKDVRVRNVTTNIRTPGGGTEQDGNSIFIFEIAGLCIAHLGHLHHTLTQQHLDEIGRVDVVMVPVDGDYTLDLDGMIEVLHAMNARLMLPMHYFNRFTLQTFVDRIRKSWPVEIADVPSVIVSKSTLPPTPKVLVLPGH
jgi:L-ascorbate metabolism protein UlaG (beta-lactamase superfamily)